MKIGTMDLLWLHIFILIYDIAKAAAATETTPVTQTTKDCTSLELPNGDVQFSNSTWSGSVATFTCKDKFYINGSCKQNVTSQCLQNKTWSVPTPSCVPKDDGVSLIISKNPFIEGSTDIITMACNTSIPPNNIQYIKIRRKLKNTWETILTLFSNNAIFNSSTSNFVKKISSSGSFNIATLALSVNESDLVCEDATLYQCHVVYTNQQCYSEEDNELNGFYFPKAVTLEGSKGGVHLENSSRSYPAQMKLGDTLDLNCTANIGSDPNVTISWLYTTPFSNGQFIRNKPKGNSSPGTSIKDDNCQYIRSATISHTIDTTDEMMGNISYSCQVEVQSPDGSLKTVMSEDVLFVEVYKLCPRPPPIENGEIVIKGTSNGSKAELICDQGYTKSKDSATCTSSGKWDTNMMCSKIGTTVASSTSSTTTLTTSTVTSITTRGNKTTQPTPLATNCTSLELQNGDVQFSNSTWIGSVATFTCNDNYYINGSCKHDVTSECLQNGTWTVSAPSCVPKDDGVTLSISKNPFIEDSDDLITITCNYNITTNDFKTMLIRRKLQSTWEVIATLYDDNKTYINSTSNFAKEITYNASIKQGATLSLFVNESDLACEDQTLYQCQVDYDNQYGICYSEVDKELRGFFFPNAITMVGRNNGSRIENSSLSYPAQMKVGDTLDLNCTANIGSDPKATVSLLSSSPFSNGQPISSIGSLGATIEGDDCQYMRSVTFNHVIDASDKSMGNISYQCQVQVITSDLKSKVIKSDILFIAIYDQCPRPPPIDNGNIVITGTSNGSKAELTCDQGYKRSTGFATCTSSGKWDTNMMCSKIDCKNLTIPINGMVTYNSNTFFNDSAEITCNDGYYLKGQNASVCQENGQWSNANNTCVLKRCASLLPPNNGFINVHNYTAFVNDSVSFSCYPGYKLVGAAVTECSLDYTWTNATPSCIIQNCTVPSAPSNGFYSLATESSVNSTASLTCKPGYRQFGNGTIQCLVNETWSEMSANCTLIECPSPTAPDNGEVNIDNGKTEVNDTVTYSCNTGYKLSETAQIKCDSNGSWDATPPTCILRKCSSPMAPDNGQVDIDNGKTEVNDTVTFSCYPGYILTGIAQLKCNTSGSWDASPPSCIVKNCTFPSAPSNGLYSSATELSVNSTASLTCNPGYRQFGNDTIQCLVNETWSEMSANCTLIECPTPVAPSNGMARLDNGTQNVNDTVSYSCYPGYKIDGAYVIECSLNGTWNEKAPFCFIQNCSEPIPPTNGHFVNKTGLSVNSSVDITCNEGYSLTGNNTSIQCLENTTWSRSFAVCNIIGCSSPLDPDNGRVDLNNGKTEVNDTVTFSCYPGYKLTGTAKSKCDSNGSWDASPPACVVQNCTNPLPPSNGTYKTSTLHVNSTALLVCNLGYNITGNGTIQCTENGTWTHTSVKCAPIECPELHAPDDGHLKLSNKTWFQSKGSFSCEKGHDLIGSNETECSLFGNWTYPEPLCKAVDCGFWYYTHSSKTDDSPCDISYSPNNTLFGSKAICSCKRGYQINSTRTSIAAECTSNMQWNIVSPPYCSPINCPYFNVSQKPMFVDYSFYENRVDTKATFVCYNNDSIIGHETVTCLTTGQWSGPIPTCKRIETTTPLCPDNTDDRNTVWNETLPGMISSTLCPKGTDGEVSRLCTEQGVWQLPVYDCVRKALVVLDKQIEAIKDNPTEENVDNALDELTSITNSTSSENKGGILSGELEKVTSILETIVDISDKSQVTTKQAESFLETTSNLLDTSNTESWKAISQKKDTSGNNNQPSSGASKILDVVGRYSDALTSLLNNTKNDTKTIKASNLVLHVAKIRENIAVKFSDVSYKSTFNLPSTSLKGLKHVSSVIYRNLSGILSSRSTTDTGNGTKHHINSEVVAVKIPNWENNKKTFKLTLSFAHFQGNKYISPQCSFWREKNSTWDVKGCTKNQRSNQSMTFCDCNHLTNFAILMSPWESDNVDTKAIDVISTVGCSISLAALVITIVFHIALWRYVKSDRVVILMHLSLALVISYAIFLGGVDRTENKDACTAVAVLLQYIYLVVFFLMLAEGIEISVSVLYVFTTASRIKWLLPAAWLIPAVIVGISLGATQLKGYGNEQFCWLSVEGGLIYAFVAPAFIIIVVNFVLLVLVLRAAFGARTLAEKSKSERTKAGVKCLCVLLPVMGCTWVIGIFYVNKNMAWIQYVFAVCNSLQGLVIFIFHCALNKQIRMAIERRKRKYASSLLTSASSTKKFSMPRASASSFSDRMDSMSDTFSRDNTSFKSRPGSERKSSISNTYEMISSNSLHSSLMQKKL